MATKPKLGIAVNHSALVVTDDNPDDYIGERYVQPAAPEATAAPEPSGVIRRVIGDGLVTAVKGAIGVPESAVGLADIATGGHAGKFLENKDGAFGFRPEQAKSYLDQFYSPEQRAAFAAVQNAANPTDSLGRRILDTGAAALQNPSTILHAVGESLPSMGAGGVLGRAVVTMAPKVAGYAAAGIGEGIVSAGSTAERIRQDTADGLTTGKQSLIAAGSGALTMGLGVVAGKAAKSMGIGDIDTLIVGGKHVDATVQKGFVRRVLEGAFTEGVLEELPQSVQEQVAQNYALGKPLDEGVDQAAVMGVLSGGAMGFGAQVIAKREVPEVGPMSRAANIAGAGVAPNAPSGPATPPAQVLTPEREKELLDNANKRMAELTEKAKGSKNEDGTEVAGQFLTPQESAEQEFLKAAGGDVQALARAYQPVEPPTTPTAPIDDQAAIARMERDAKREQSAAQGRARSGDDDTEGGVVSGAPEAPTPAPTAPTSGTLADDTEEDLPLPDQDDITTPSGGPFKERFAAKRAATRQPDPENFIIVRVQGGFVLRRKAGAASDDIPETPAVAADTSGALGTEPGGSDGNGTTQPGLPGALDGADAATPEGRSAAAEPVGDSGTGATAVKPITAGDAKTRPQPTTAGTAAAEVQPAGTRGTNAEDVLKGVNVYTPGSIDKAANEAAPSPQNDRAEPTDGQKDAGNYKLGHATVGGLDLSIENPAGSVRRGKDRDGKAWENKLQHHYGYIKGTIGNDKDHVDAFVKPGTAGDFAGTVFVIDQVHPDTGKFDEHKVLLGFDDEAQARAAYAANYAKGWNGLQSISAMDMDEFKAWVYDGPKNTPLVSAEEAYGGKPKKTPTAPTGPGTIAEPAPPPVVAQPKDKPPETPPTPAEPKSPEPPAPTGKNVVHDFGTAMSGAGLEVDGLDVRGWSADVGEKGEVHARLHDKGVVNYTVYSLYDDEQADTFSTTKLDEAVAAIERMRSDLLDKEKAPEPAPAPTPEPEKIDPVAAQTELRKRLSVLQSLLECMA